MRGFIRAFEVDESKTPHTLPNPEPLPVPNMREWTRKLDELGADEVVVLADDCFAHSQIKSYYESVQDTQTDVKLMTRGRYIDHSYQRWAHENDVKFIVPSDWYNPYAREVFGSRNNDMGWMLNSFPNVEVWSTLDGNMLEQLKRLLGIPLRVVLTSPPEYMDAQEIADQKVKQMSQQENVEVLTANHFMPGIAKSESMFRAPAEFNQEVIERGRDVVGSLYVDVNGWLYPPVHVDAEPVGPLGGVARRDLSDRLLPWVA